jgi:hypothetical protein
VQQLSRLNSRVRLAHKKEGSMAFYAVDVRDRVIQRVTQQYLGADNTRYFLIEAGSAKLAWAKAMRASDAPGSAECDSCGHSYCHICADCSLSQRYSDYWICHGCGALTPRSQKFTLREVSYGLGQD